MSRNVRSRELREVVLLQYRTQALLQKLVVRDYIPDVYELRFHGSLGGQNDTSVTPR